MYVGGGCAFEYYIRHILLIPGIFLSTWKEIRSLEVPASTSSSVEHSRQMFITRESPNFNGSPSHEIACVRIETVPRQTTSDIESNVHVNQIPHFTIFVNRQYSRAVIYS